MPGTLIYYCEKGGIKVNSHDKLIFYVKLQCLIIKHVCVTLVLVYFLWFWHDRLFLKYCMFYCLEKKFAILIQHIYAVIHNHTLTYWIKSVRVWEILWVFMTPVRGDHQHVSFRYNILLSENKNCKFKFMLIDLFFFQIIRNIAL